LIEAKNEMFFVKHKKYYERVFFNDILWIVAQGSSIKINLEKKTYFLSLNLSSFIRQVQHENLYRIHRSYIVNLKKVTALNNKFVMIPRNGIAQNIPIGKIYVPNINSIFLKVISE